MIRAMQTLAPDFFCPLTNPQPYQRDGAQRPPTKPGCAASFNVEIVTWKFSRRSAVRWSDWLDADACTRVAWRTENKTISAHKSTKLVTMTTPRTRRCEGLSASYRAVTCWCL